MIFLFTLCCFFFFQAEDGIRDTSVTGVQTCALPICLVSHPELTLRPDAALPLVFNGFDYPLFFAHGSFPTARTPLARGQLRLPLEAQRSEERRVGKECRSRW